MRSWLQSQWRALRDSYDEDEALAGSQPAAVAIAAGALAAVLGCIGYLPALARLSRFARPWIALALTAAGAATTLIAWRHRCAGRAGTLATLLDNGWYSAALVYGAASCQGGFGIGLACAHGLMVLAFPARAYGLTLLFALVMAVPVLLGLALPSVSLSVAVIIVTSYVMTLLLALLTGNRRELLRQRARLTHAFGAVSRVADESVQAALATTLLSLGHFLHELKNYQTAIGANLSFVQLTAELDDATREALVDAMEAQTAEQRLVRDIVESLRQRAKPNNAVFVLGDVVGAAAGEAKAIDVVVQPMDQRFAIRGQPDHLQGVLSNLIRNAQQAGASAVQLDLRIEPSGEAVRLLVHDDGPGIDPARHDALFAPFAGSTKVDGTGLGLYLCRRYVELLGGSIEVVDGPLGGAGFAILLPGRVIEGGAASEEPAAESEEPVVEPGARSA